MDRHTQEGSRSRTRRPSAAEAGGGATAEPVQILFVGGDPACRTALAGQLSCRHRCTHIARLDEAQLAITRTHFHVILIDPRLPDGDGLELADLVGDMSPTTKTIIMVEGTSFKTALRAIRSGASDYLRTPVDPVELAERVQSALDRSQTEVRREQRIRRLQHVCSELSAARREISDQVDTLCSDLVMTYQELNEQMSDIVMASEFRTLLRQELDVEELLRTTLEYLLTKTGPTNAAVFLPDSTRHFGLGAYVNYDCPRDSIDSLLDHLCGAICPQMTNESEIVSFHDADEFAQWIGIEGGFIADSHVIAFSCPHEDECMAVIVLFRNADSPFGPELATLLDTLRLIFAEQLSHVINVHHRARPEWPKDAEEDDFDDDFGFGDYGGGGLAA